MTEFVKGALLWWYADTEKGPVYNCPCAVTAVNDEGIVVRLLDTLELVPVSFAGRTGEARRLQFSPCTVVLAAEYVARLSEDDASDLARKRRELERAEQDAADKKAARLALLAPQPESALA